MVRSVIEQSLTGASKVVRPWTGADLQDVTGDLASALNLDRPFDDDGIRFPARVPGPPPCEVYPVLLIGMPGGQELLIIDELGFVPLSKTGAELLFEVISQRYERGSIIITSNLPFDEWTEVFGTERLTGAILDRLTHHVHILEMNGESYRLRQSRNAKT